MVLRRRVLVASTSSVSICVHPVHPCISVLRRLRSIVLALAACLAAYGPLRAEPGGGLPLPAPGTYKLDRIQPVPAGAVLNGDLVPQALSAYATGTVTLLAFFYGHCADPQGCPLAWSAFEAVRAQLRADPALGSRVRLVFLSFDPAHDTPEVMRAFTESFNKDKSTPPWLFLTTASEGDLGPLLHGFGQEIARVGGGDMPVINHLLKVFLIDRTGWVREIYAANLLDPTLLLTDIRTLALEEKAGP
jgi:protein SCO1